MNGLENVLARHKARADIVDAAVVGFAHDAVDAPDVLVVGKGEGVVDDAVQAGGDVEGVGEDNRRFNVAEFLDLRIAGHLAEGIAQENARGHLFFEDVAAVGQDRGHARVCALFVVVHVDLADENARHVRDGVVGAGLQHADFNAVVARAQRDLFGQGGRGGHHTGQGDGGFTKDGTHFDSPHNEGCDLIRVRPTSWARSRV